MTAKRILIIEDEKPIRDLIAFGLRRAGYEVKEAEDCREARARIVDVRPDLMLVDWMLPDMSGLEVLRKLREESPQLPVLLLTAKDAVEDRIAGLTAGGDDYVTKPFSLEEVVLRLRALLRRTGVTTEDSGAQLIANASPTNASAFPSVARFRRVQSKGVSTPSYQ